MVSPDYAKKKNAELEELLKARGLPHTGKKAELVARLQESDAAQQASGAAADSTAAPVDDEITFDDEPTTQPEPTSEPAAAAVAAGGLGHVANPTAVPNQVATDEPQDGTDTKVVLPAGVDDSTTVANAEATGAAVEQQDQAQPAEPPAPKVDFSAHIPASTVDEEMERRKARAARFGTGATGEGDADAEAEKALERAKRFGTQSETKQVKGLDEALPEREKKRGRREQGGRDEKRRDSRRRDGRGQGGGRRGDRRGGGGGGGGGGGRAPEMSSKDREAAERRKARFGGA